MPSPKEDSGEIWEGSDTSQTTRHDTTA